MVVVGHAGIGAPDKSNLLTRPDIFVSPSKRGEKWAKSLILSKGIKIVHIPHGVDLDKFSPSVEKTHLDLNRPVILCVSSFDPFKRVNLAVEAVAKLKRGSLLIIGGDREDGRIDRMAHKLLGEKRYLKIRVPPSEIASYYASSDVFTLPSSTSEAFGLVYLEALASNLPVVATDDELRKEIVGDAGILVDPEDTSAYSKALTNALKIDWGDKPRRQAEKFSWKKIVREYESLFRNLNRS